MASTILNNETVLYISVALKIGINHQNKTRISIKFYPSSAVAAVEVSHNL